MQKLIEDQMRVQVEKEKQKMIYQMKADAAAAAAAAKLQSSSFKLSSTVLSLIVCIALIVTFKKISFLLPFHSNSSHQLLPKHQERQARPP